MSKDYWFFLSYARNDAQGDPYLKEFYEKLANDVRGPAGLRSDTRVRDIGFIDDLGLESGTQWTEGLAEALQSSRVLVCLYSRSFFNSPWCGREFEVFRQRVASWVAATQAAQWPPLIQPVLWDRPDQLPQRLPGILGELGLQHTHRDFGEMYAKEGLYYIMRMKEDREYNRFLLAFRERVAQAGKQNPLPRLATLQSWDQVPSAFDAVPVAPSAPPSRLPATSSLPPTSGPEVVWFVYVAGRDQDYINGNVRNQVACYGPQGGASWRPYMPPSEAPVGILTTKIALNRNPRPMLRETLNLSVELVTHVRHALDTNTPVILIVDPWSLQLNSFRAPLAELNRQVLANCGVIIIWNDQDQETQATSATLRNAINQTFADTITSKQLYFRDSVSESQMEEALNEAIREVQDKIDKRTNLLRPVDAGRGSLPLLNVNPGSPSR